MKTKNSEGTEKRKKNFQLKLLFVYARCKTQNTSIESLSFGERIAQIHVALQYRTARSWLNLPSDLLRVALV